MLNWRDPRNPLTGGAERVSHAYLAALVQRGHEVCWFANDFPGAARTETLDGITLVRGGGRGSSILAARSWYRQQPRFDLVIDQHHGIPWYAPWWCGTQCLAYIHEVLGPIWSSFYRWPLSTVGRWQERWTHRLYRDVPFWTVSESTAQTLRLTGVKEVRVWPNGTDTEALAELNDKPLKSPLRLAVVSRLAPNKRIDHCLRALKELERRGLDARMTIVGTGESAEELRQLTAELGLDAKVHFAGRLEEAPKNELLRQTHLLLHSSVREGWGLNVIEANAMGTPAVVYPVAGLVDSTVHGQTGLVVAQETPEALAEGVLHLAQTPGLYERLRQAAVERARSLHWNQVLPQTCDWLESLARRPKPGR